MFRLVTSDTYGSESMISITAKPGAEYKIGQPLVTDGGVAVVATGSAQVQYICEQNITAPAQGESKVVVHRVLPQYIYETEFTANASAVSEGDKVTIADGGVGVTATEGGTAEIVSIIDPSIGGKVRVRLA